MIPMQAVFCESASQEHTRSGKTEKRKTLLAFIRYRLFMLGTVPVMCFGLISI
jgi:hypothetical protein